jgi:predicted lipoprotein with Yx(FWY)xxD motif
MDRVPRGARLRRECLSRGLRGRQDRRGHRTGLGGRDDRASRGRRVLADGPGFTLYAFMPDHQGRSQCSGVCAQAWPPLILPAGIPRPAARDGAEAALLGTVRRPGGARQVTYDGWPLYLWEGDHEPGQATGQADDMGLWYVLSADGSVDTTPVTGQSGG